MTGSESPAQSPRLTPEEALSAINELRCNVIALQNAGWSNTIYPLVAILNAAGFSYTPPNAAAKQQHLDCYGGAGGYPGADVRERDDE